MVKNLHGNSGDEGCVPGSGSSPGVGNGYSLQYSCLENSMGSGAVGYSLWGCKKSDTTERLSKGALQSQEACEAVNDSCPQSMS